MMSSPTNEKFDDLPKPVSVDAMNLKQAEIAHARKKSVNVAHLKSNEAEQDKYFASHGVKLIFLLKAAPKDTMISENTIKKLISYIKRCKTAVYILYKMLIDKAYWNLLVRWLKMAQEGYYAEFYSKERRLLMCLIQNIVKIICSDSVKNQ
jgi:electron transfer flavoprotein alpha subunit